MLPAACVWISLFLYYVLAVSSLGVVSAEEPSEPPVGKKFLEFQFHIWSSQSVEAVTETATTCFRESQASVLDATPGCSTDGIPVNNRSSPNDTLVCSTLTLNAAYMAEARSSERLMTSSISKAIACLSKTDALGGVVEVYLAGKRLLLVQVEYILYYSYVFLREVSSPKCGSNRIAQSDIKPATSIVVKDLPQHEYC